MTVGYLLDLFIINEIRKEKMGDVLDPDVNHDLNRQNGFYLREIGKYIIEIADGDRPGVFAKHKNYDKGIGEPYNGNAMTFANNPTVDSVSIAPFSGTKLLKLVQPLAASLKETVIPSVAVFVVA